MPIEITMPRLSDTMESGTVIKWNVSEGDTVSAGDVIADVETDKATMEMQAFDDGTVAALMVEEGKSVDIGTVLAILAEDGEDVDDVKSGGASDGNGEAANTETPESTEDDPSDEDGDDDASESQAAEQPEKKQKKPTEQEPAAHDSAANDQETSRSEDEADDGPRLRISPVARRMADKHRIDVHQIQGSGPSGRIIKRDVQNAIDAGQETAAAVAPGASQRDAGGGQMVTRVAQTQYTDDDSGGLILRDQKIPLSNMRQTIAKRLVESKTTIPHYQVTVAFEMDAILTMRQTLNDQLAPQGVKLSVNDFLVRAAALAMHEHPMFNCSWGGDHLVMHGEVNIGVAIAIPEERGGGLVVAGIRNADRKSLRVISAETKQLAEKARTRGLSVEEMSDTTFTISNLGMFGVEHFTAIINPPNSAIMAVGAANAEPVVRNGQLEVGHIMRATLSSDHRVIDGATAAQYLQTLKRMIENPAALLV